MNFNRNTPGEMPKSDPNAAGGVAARFWAGVGDSASPPLAQGGYSLRFYSPLVDPGGPAARRPAD